MTRQPECAACGSVLIGPAAKLACKVCTEHVCASHYYGKEGCEVCSPADNEHDED